MTERTWIHGFVSRLARVLARRALPHGQIEVIDGFRLPYTAEVHAYPKSGSPQVRTSRYQTDLVVFDILGDGTRIPRVVVEGKLGSVSSHDGITYSAKAATHKHVHPYLRYGILIGKHNAIPARLVRHGAHFDFMATWAKARATRTEWRRFCLLISDELDASRALQALLATNRSKVRRKYTLLHRPLKLT